MSIRKMKLKDYGITPGRAAELKEMVKDKQYYSLVIEACNRANEFLASHLVKSFTENAMQMFMDINEKHWHYSDLHYRHAEDIHFSNRMEN